MIRGAKDLEQEWRVIASLVQNADTRATNRALASALRAPLTMLGAYLRRSQEAVSLSEAQSMVLSQLSGVEALRISDLVAGTDRAIATITEIVGRMEVAGLVRKRPAIDDRRQVLVSITTKGWEALATMVSQRTESLTHRLDSLSPEDRQALMHALPALWRLAHIDVNIWPQIKMFSRQSGETNYDSAVDR